MQAGAGIADSRGTGDLPADTVDALATAPGGSDEGRAMAEIVYDEAPGVSGIGFETASGGPRRRRTRSTRSCATA